MNTTIYLSIHLSIHLSLDRLSASPAKNVTRSCYLRATYESLINTTIYLSLFRLSASPAMNVTRFCYFRTTYSRGCDDEDQRILFLSQVPGFDTMQHKLYDIRRSFIPAAPSTQDEFNVTSDWFQIDKNSKKMMEIFCFGMNQNMCQSIRTGHYCYSYETVRHYNWSLNNQDSRFQTHASSAILAWSESTSKSIPSVSDTIVVEPQLCSSTLNTSAARTCHVCGLKYTKSMNKKLCTCKKILPC